MTREEVADDVGRINNHNQSHARDGEAYMSQPMGDQCEYMPRPKEGWDVPTLVGTSFSIISSLLYITYFLIHILCMVFFLSVLLLFPLISRTLRVVCC